jgi:hypothetical protein
MSIEKKQLLTTRFHHHALNAIDAKQVKLTLDWGCGGGLLARIVAGFSDIILLDATRHSLMNATKYLSDIRAARTIHFTDSCLPFPFSMTTATLGKLNIDLLICYNVIYHLPSLEYWRRLAEIWLEIRPRYIAMQTKTAPKTQVAKNYAQNYINALILSEQDFLNPFGHAYSIIYHHTEPHSPGKHSDFVVLKANHAPAHS